MSFLQRLGNQVSVSLSTDNQGFLGKECPVESCLGYFKVKPGTGLTGNNLPCHCPYCGHTAGNDTFYTQEQIEYAKSVAIRHIMDAVTQDLKSMEFDHRPQPSSFGIGISMKVKPGTAHPVRYYREKQLETDVLCDNCTLSYTIYGVFGFCPDCGAHNSLQILNKNLELVEKEIALAGTVEEDLSEHLIGDALENAVSAFDGFGRELCRIHAGRSSNPTKAASISFQNLINAKKHIQELFGFDLSADSSEQEWDAAYRCFQKRHLLAHKMGIVDDAYIKATSDPSAIVGRKALITADEVKALSMFLSKLGAYFISQLPSIG